MVHLYNPRSRNKEKNVFGLMPHPERAVEDILGNSDGLDMLKGFIHR